MASLDRTYAPARRAWNMAHLRRISTSYILLAPFLILFIAFVLWPIVMSAYLSLTNYNGIKEAEFVGLENYADLLSDKRFIKSIVNVFQYVVLVVLLNTGLGLTLALVFRSQDRISKVFRTLLFLPAVTSSIATLTVWGWILSGEDYGLGNTILSWFGYERISFLSTPSLSIPIMVTLALWGGAGMTMIFFLAGLQAIPQEMTEAAAIDGASPLQRIFYITLPLLRPTFLYVIITGMIGAFQIFDIGYVLFSGTGTLGGVLDSALTPVLYLYYMAFSRFRLGYASAIAWLLFAIIIMLTIVNLRLGRVNEAD